VSGRYCKYSREIAQTEYFCNVCRGKGCWYCNETGHFCEESVEELLSEVIVPHFGAKLLILHGAGREDMDVLMLGSGRPFIAEFLMPKKRSADLSLIENEINEKFKGKISVNSLKLSSLDEVSLVKDTHHEKSYAALVHANNEVDFSKIPVNQKLIVAQNTPTRVAARRADLERTKEVTIMRVGEINSQEFVLIMRTSHGTYVKEFISGDNNRTNPSISSLVGTHCECMLLDVTNVCE
ncbi:MAG: tRNA pseudouridine(54/55) synthase Pus10, partial [archaeon]